jgi:hypothetical protein
MQCNKVWSAIQLAKVHGHFHNLQANKSLGRCESNCKVELVTQSLTFWDLQCKLISRWQGITCRSQFLGYTCSVYYQIIALKHIYRKKNICIQHLLSMVSLDKCMVKQWFGSSYGDISILFENLNLC